MYTAAYAFLLLAMLCSLCGAGVGALQVWNGKTSDLGLIEKLNLASTTLFGLASLILLRALVSFDFSVEYVYNYTDLSLPLFYRVTAFWGGQAGSLLFWALMVAVCGAGFQFTPAYHGLSQETRTWFWIFFLAIMAFFGLLLCAWSNPFIQFDTMPADGRGLNPMLQNPGMIIHPPLLFFGYGGFVIPGCLALAQGMRRAGGRTEGINALPAAEENWHIVARPFTLTAWLFLTAGIVLGAWWAYMELGWGGYWAWDPVENASLLPWLIGTAALHTGLLETRRGKLARVNIFLMGLTTVSAFFATYLVRGNVVNSVHAFGAGGVGPALLMFVLGSLLIITLVAWQGDNRQGRELAGLETREGFLVLSSWMFLAISAVILLATLWPVISSLWSATSQGLTADFYNRVCMPLFSILLALLAVCPWLKWQSGIRSGKRLLLILFAFAAALALFWTFGVHKPLPLMAAALCVACLLSVGLFLAERGVRRNPSASGAGLVHLGLVLVALGITFSGPYKVEVEGQLARGESIVAGPFTVTLLQLYEGQDQAGSFNFLEAEIQISKGDTTLGVIAPQRRIYTKFPQQAFAESATLFSLGDEFYAALLGLDSEQRAVLRLSSHPLVNWLWIGGVLMTLAPFLSLSGTRRREDDENRQEIA